MITRRTKSFHSTLMSRQPVMSLGIPQYMDFDEIVWDTMQYVGNGAYGVVYSNGLHAVKIGNVDLDDVNDLILLGKYRRAVQVYGYWQNIVLPTQFVAMRPRLLHKFYEPREAHMMAMQLATPLYSRHGSDAEWEVAQNAARSLYRKLQKVDYFWGDSHGGNIGKVGGRHIVLDV